MVKLSRGKSGLGKKATGGKNALPAQDAAHQVQVDPHAQDYGASKVIQLDGEDKAKLGIKYAPFKVEIVDVDVVLVFNDGTKIIIPGMALAAFSGRKPVIVFSDKEFSTDQAVAMVGEISPQDASLQLHLSSADADKPTTDPKDGAGVQPADAGKAQGEQSQKEQQQVKAAESTSRLTEKISDTPSSSAPPPGVISARASDPAPDDAIGPAGIGKLVPKLTYTLFNSEGVVHTTEAGQTVIKGDTGGPNSSKDAGFTAQSAQETISGSDGNDTIYADRQDHAPIGSTLRVLHVEAMVPAKGLTLKEFLIPSLPQGYTVVNGTLTEKGWLVSAEQGNITHVTTKNDPVTGQPVTLPVSQSFFSFDIQLTYTVPPTGTPANSSGFQDEFYLPVMLGLSSDGKTSAFAVSVATHFGIKEVNDAAGMTVTDPVTGDPVYVLFSNPPGAKIDAGAGDDHIVAGAGADQIDGGAGSDVVDYSRSGHLRVRPG